MAIIGKSIRIENDTINIPIKVKNPHKILGKLLPREGIRELSIPMCDVENLIGRTVNEVGMALKAHTSCMFQNNVDVGKYERLSCVVDVTIGRRAWLYVFLTFNNTCEFIVLVDMDFKIEYEKFAQSRSVNQNIELRVEKEWFALLKLASRQRMK